MAATEPIRSKKDLQELKDFYIVNKPNVRNSTLINFGLNSILRISDLLNLKWKDVYNFEENHFRTHIQVTETKTGKENKIALNQNAIESLEILKQSISDLQPDMYLFYGKNGFYSHLSRSQAYRIIRQAAEGTHLGNHISCHSLRKTFGYHAWKNGIQPAMLMELYNHSSYSITKHYLGIDQNEKDSVFLEINL